MSIFNYISKVILMYFFYFIFCFIIIISLGIFIFFLAGVFFELWQYYDKQRLLFIQYVNKLYKKE